MPKPGSRTAKSILEQITVSSENTAGLLNSPFGALGGLVRKNAESVMDPTYCDELVSRILLTGKSSLDSVTASKLLNVADVASLVVHPFFVRASARKGVSFYISSDGDLHRLLYTPRSLQQVELDGPIEPQFYVEPEWYQHLVSFVDGGLPVLLIGPSGSGKTEAVERVFNHRDQKLEIISCTPAMTADDFEGTIELREGSTVFIPSSCAEAVRNGHGLLLDEVDAAPAEACYSLYRALEGKDMCIARKGFEGCIKRHSSFRAVGTQNTEGRGDDRGIHHGRAFQDEAFLDRWSNYIRVDYLPSESEILVLCKRTGIPRPKAALIVRVATELRRALLSDRIMFCASMRRTLAVAANIAAGMSPEDAWRFAVQNRATSADQQAIDDLVNRIYGSSAKKK